MTRATGRAVGVDKAEISCDGGRTFSPIDLANFDEAVGGKYACHLRLSFSKRLAMLKIEIVVQHNRCALPYLSPGTNTVSVSVAEPKALGHDKLVVTYGYCLGSRRGGYEALCDEGAELARAHKAAWSDTPTIVQKVFSAKDLPATFEILVPTPKGFSPVYPRMLFLRREVIGPGRAPALVPKGALTATVGTGEQLKTLPNPFLMGIARPPKRVVRPRVTRKIPLELGHVVWRDKQGKTRDDVWKDHFIKTRPKSAEAWVMLVGGKLGTLPAARDIAAARLCVPVTHAIPQAPTMLGAALLKAPFEPMRPYDLKQVGEVVGTTVVPKYAKPAEPKYYKLDITRALKRLATGEVEFHGLALQTVPNRGVDDGWTTRIDITRSKPITIELDVYAK